jgi:hypothetical protein
LNFEQYEVIFFKLYHQTQSEYFKCIEKMSHNYVRAHEGLNGITPAEACGIKIEGQNKWMTLIQNSTCEKE